MSKCYENANEVLQSSSEYASVSEKITSKQQDSNGRRIMNFLMRESKMKMTKKQAAAFAGNFGHESGWNPKATNPNGGAYGIAQWMPTYGRQTYLKKHYNKWDTLDDQLKFVEYELTNIYNNENKGGHGTLNYTPVMGLISDNSLSLEQMTWIVCQVYESKETKDTYSKEIDPKKFNRETFLEDRISWAKRAYALV